MKNQGIIKSSLICLLFGNLSLSPEAIAQSTNSKSGQEAFAWIDLVENARPAGLNQAYTALAAGVDGIGLNPAGLALTTNRHNFLSGYQYWSLETNKGMLAYSSHNWNFTYALTMSYQDEGFQEALDINDNGEKVSTGKSIHPYHFYPGLSLAKEFGKSFRGGVTIKLPLGYLGDFERSQWSMGMGLDLGFQYQPKSKLFTVGAALLNWGASVRNYLEDDDQKFLLPVTGKIGVVYHRLSKSKSKLILDVGLPYHSLPYTAVGIEHRLSKYIQIRGGSKFNFSELKYYFEDFILGKREKEFNNINVQKIAAGFSIIHNEIYIDYAIQYWIYLGFRNYVTLRYSI